MDKRIEVSGDLGSFEVSIENIHQESFLNIYKIQFSSEQIAELNTITLNWQISANDIKGVWTTNVLHEKRLRADWEAPSVQSRVSVEAPVLTLFSNSDINVQTFACSDAINTIQLEAPIREEDNLIYCKVTLFKEKMPVCKFYKMELRIDSRPIHFSQALRGVSEWWESFERLKPMDVFEYSKVPLYSTWYSFHQSLDPKVLLEECKIGKELGNKLIVIDDGWQTNDSNRGYDYTGDWEPERLTNLKSFSDEVHALGMKVMLWYSVPFCGIKSKAYQKFKGKFLTENHRWAPVFDPRYPEVRAYLTDKYVTALQTWDLDGFKLDFIDDFKVYPETVLTKENGRDFSSVNEAVYQLMTQISEGLLAVKPDILIEFRQKYIGPAMRKFGNMFRAFDCPNDALTNRLRTTDVKLICGSSAVHSDMYTWHASEKVEIAALQITSILFSVPQLSVRLKSIAEDVKRMIGFYTEYWMNNREILLEGNFIPHAPLANYPLLSSSKDNKIIIGVYENMIVEIESEFQYIDLVNGKMSEQIAFEAMDDLGNCNVKIFNCMGDLDWESIESFDEGVHTLEVPANGMICIQRAES